ncbi:MAG: hypothetical protein SNF33_01915 [Candidatus Algichlamydia australiensis]|nr:hypothetical protein [Chlamydiales bacterium]
MNGRSLEVSHKFKEFLCSPDRAYPIVHIAGSNGKGSVAIKIARALEHAGYRVGLFTSPHTHTYFERIRINGEMISEKEVEEIGQKLLDYAEVNYLEPTFFETTTWIAMEYFRKNQVEIAIIEAGLGGRLDSTNAIDKRLLSVIPSISLEHKEVLGNSIEEIAKEKAGIIRNNDVVLGPSANCEEILEVAKIHGATVHIAEEGLHYEIENQNVARKSLELMRKHFTIPSQAINQGLLAKMPGRFELLEPDILCDAAHNPAGLRALLHLLEMAYPSRNFRFGIALSNHKDHDAFLQLLEESEIPYHWLEVEHERLQRAEKQISFQKLKELARRKGELLVLCGSIYLRGAIKQTSLV